MWHALRAEFDYSLPWILGGLGIATGVVIIVSVVFSAVGGDGPPSHAAAGIRGMFMIMAPMIVGFIVQGYRHEERRARLLLAGPLTPRGIATVFVLLPVILSAIGVLAAALMMVIEALVTGRFEVESVNIAGNVGGMIFMGLMIGLVIQESTAAHREGRRRAAVAGWASFGVAVLALAVPSVAAAVFQGPLSWPFMHLGNLVGAATTMVATVALASGRTDFTH